MKGNVLRANPGRLRVARADDEAQPIELWAQLFDEDGARTPASWVQHLQDWFAHALADPATARFPVIAVRDEWARSIAADRIDLSATPEGEHLYEKLGFVRTSAPRMKLVL